MVTRMDTDVGAILDHLQSLGLSENTILFFTSDNGAPEDLDFQSTIFFNSNGGLRGYKFSLYEGGIRVPMITLWPGQIPPRTTAIPMALWDLVPTILELAGVPRPDGLDGVSMVPMLLGDDLSQSQHSASAPLYWEASTPGWRGQAARLGRFKAVRPEIVGGRDLVELYDLETDPAETTDLSDRSEHCADLIALKTIMNAAHTAPPQNPGGNYPIPPLQLDCPPNFANGFESSDVSAWSRTAP
jgi:arylsulfatase A-like enzyme